MSHVEEVCRKGVQVNIKRSNGRVHTAIISGCDGALRTVTVEWNEQGETKGKTIDLDVIVQLNPEIKAQIDSASAGSGRMAGATGDSTVSGFPNHDTGPSSKSGVVSSRSAVVQHGDHAAAVSGKADSVSVNDTPSMPINAGGNTQTYEQLQAISAMPPPSAAGRPTAAGRKRPVGGGGVAGANSAASSTAVDMNARRETRAFGQSADAPGRRSLAPGAQRPNKFSAVTESAALSGNGNIPSSSLAQPSASGVISAGGPAAGRRSMINPRSSMLPSTANLSIAVATPATAGNNNLNSTVAAANSAAAAQRTSTVVGEIQKMEKNRAERRARMDEAREERQKLMNVDPGNPNWQYLGMIRDFRAEQHMQPLQISDKVKTFQINVCLRKRPLNKKEVLRKDIDVITVTTRDTLYVHEPRQKVDLTKFLENQPFRFDYVFDDESTNEMVYKFTAQPLIDTIFEGGFATCFAYGQTGSGKTHTMGGEFVGNGSSQDSSRGIYAFVAQDVFRLLAKPKNKKSQLSVKCSFFEIYSGKLFDLLNKKTRLKVMEDGAKEVNIVGLIEKSVHSVDDVLEVIRNGNSVRTSGQTSANAHSSRSHAVFQILLRRREGNDNNKLHGKFSLIDLAGNERGADTMSSNRTTRMEGAEINKSLLALKECVRALGRKNAVHLPFRGSKLTQVLRDSFIGQNSKTCMIAMISPGISCCEHTLNTLRYANRVKELTVTDADNAAAAPAGGSAAVNMSDADLSTEINNNNVRSAPKSSHDLSMDESAADVDADAASLRNSIENLSARLDAATNGHIGAHSGVAGVGIADHSSSVDDDMMLQDEPSEDNNNEQTDLSPEMYSFNETLSRLNEIEEDVQEEHKKLLDKLNSVQKDLRHAYAVTNEVDYDIDEYVNEMEKALDQLVTAATRMKDKVGDFRSHLRAEEEMSQTIYKNAAANNVGNLKNGGGVGGPSGAGNRK